MSVFMVSFRAVVSCLAIATASQPALAQAVNGSDESAALPATTYGDIIVTAQKRAESINDVGLAISAFGGKELERRGISDLADVAQAVPNLSYATSPNNTPIFTLRGVGFVESSLPSYPTVSVSVDEVPLPFPALTALTAFDLERIEVLKGPQGTLFGQNTTGGAINYVAAKPTDYLVAGFDLTYGRFDRVELNGFVSGPLTDSLRARIAARVTHADDWQKSVTRNDKIGEARTFAARMLLDWTPTDRLKFTASLTAWRDQSDPVAAQFIGVGITQHPGFLLPDLLTYPLAPENARYADWGPGHPFADNKFYQGVLRGDLEVADGISLTSITSYIDYDTDAFTDNDGTPYQIGENPQTGYIRSFSQELRLANDGAGGIQWVMGGNYSRDKVFDEIHNIFSDQSTGRRFGIYDDGINTRQTMKNYAVFGNVEYDLTPQLTIKGGARYTKADRIAFNCTYGADGGITGALLAGNSLFLRQNVLGDADAELIPIADGECIELDPQTFEPAITPTRTVLKEDNLSWRAGIDFKPSNALLFYANITKGYKAGSVPRVGATSTDQYQPVKQESVMAYEAGFKAGLLANRATLNGTAFWYDYRDKQLRTKVIDPIFNLLEVIENIPKSRIRGVELEMRAQPIDGLSLALAGSFTDAKITEYVGVNATGVLSDFDGTVIPFVPKWQFSAAVDYEWHIGNLKPFAGGSLTGRTKTYSIIGGEDTFFNGKRAFQIDGYTTVDLRAGVGADDDRWTLTIFGKNLFSTYYWDNVFTTFETIIRYPAKPATYGVTFSFRYK